MDSPWRVSSPAGINILTKTTLDYNLRFIKGFITAPFKYFFIQPQLQFMMPLTARHPSPIFWRRAGDEGDEGEMPAQTFAPLKPLYKMD